jgi:hypothetical protein
VATKFEMVPDKDPTLGAVCTKTKPSHRNYAAHTETDS